MKITELFVVVDSWNNVLVDEVFLSFDHATAFLLETVAERDRKLYTVINLDDHIDTTRREAYDEGRADANLDNSWNSSSC